MSSKLRYPVEDEVRLSEETYFASHTEDDGRPTAQKPANVSPEKLGSDSGCLVANHKTRNPKETRETACAVDQTQLTRYLDEVGVTSRNANPDTRQSLRYDRPFPAGEQRKETGERKRRHSSPSTEEGRKNPRLTEHTQSSPNTVSASREVAGRLQTQEMASKERYMSYEAQVHAKFADVTGKMTLNELVYWMNLMTANRKQPEFMTEEEHSDIRLGTILIGPFCERSLDRNAHPGQNFVPSKSSWISDKTRRMIVRVCNRDGFFASVVYTHNGKGIAHLHHDSRQQWCNLQGPNDDRRTNPYGIKTVQVDWCEVNIDPESYFRVDERAYFPATNDYRIVGMQ